MTKQLESFYEVLKVDPRATVAEIVTAYHAARGAFSKDSVATYSLFSAEEIQEELQKLEQAYVTLSNIDKRAEYDRRLAGGTHNDTEPTEPRQRVDKPAPTAAAAPAEVSAPSIPLPSSDVSVDVPEEVNGVYLKEVREKKGLSQDDVARITKIPSKFLRSIESDDFKRLPARVYIQGFIKNMASLYRIDAKTLAQGYLSYLDKRNPPATT